MQRTSPETGGLSTVQNPKTLRDWQIKDASNVELLSVVLSRIQASVNTYSDSDTQREFILAQQGIEDAIMRHNRAVALSQNQFTLGDAERTFDVQSGR